MLRQQETADRKLLMLIMEVNGMFSLYFHLLLVMHHSETITNRPVNKKARRLKRCYSLNITSKYRKNDLVYSRYGQLDSMIYSILISPSSRNGRFPTESLFRKPEKSSENNQQDSLCSHCQQFRHLDAPMYFVLLGEWMPLE